MAELKPCPFCGGKVYVAELNGRYSEYAIAHEKPGCPAQMMRGSRKSVESAWNDRAPADGATASDELAGAIAYQLTKRLVIDMSTARATVDAALGVETSAGGPREA